METNETSEARPKQKLLMLSESRSVTPTDQVARGTPMSNNWYVHTLEQADKSKPTKPAMGTYTIVGDWC